MSWNAKPQPSRKPSLEASLTSMKARLFDLHVQRKRDSEEYKTLTAAIHSLDTKPGQRPNDRY